MKIKFKRQSIFVQLITFFLVMIIILFGVGYSVFLWGINIITEQFINETCVQNKNFSDKLSTEFKRINKLQYGILNDWDLKKLSTMSSNYTAYEQSLMILRLQDKILAVKTSSNLIDEIGIIVPQVSKSIGTAHNANIGEDTVKKYEGYVNLKQDRIVYVNDKLMLISRFPDCFFTTDVGPSYIIHTDISKNAMIDFLNDMSNYKENNEFLFSQSRNMLIANDDSSSVTYKIKELILSTKGNKIKSGNLKMNNTYFLREEIDGEKYIIVYTDTQYSDIKLVRYISEKVAFRGLEKYKLTIWVFALVSLLTIIVFSKSLYKKIHTPLKKLVKAFEKVKKADLSVSIKHQRNDEFKYIYESFNDMVSQLNTLIDEVYKGKLLIEKSKLKQLQSQINPHFLYNSFLILKNRIQIGDNEFAEEFCRELGLYFMFITRNKQDEVNLKYEVEHAVIYANIQYARFSSRLEMNIEELPKECENMQVPRLILQPILENAFEHSLENLESNGFLHMGYILTNEYLDIVIEDNGTEIDDKEIEMLDQKINNNEIEITGIININQRLKLRYSNEYGLILGKSEYGGLKVTVRLPIEKSEELTYV